eukprot:Em0008g420a
MENEDASKVAKETVYGNKSGSVHKVQHFKKQVDEHSVTQEQGQSGLVASKSLSKLTLGLQLTGDLKGVGTYFDDILVSGSNASEHLENLRALLQRLQDKGLRCHFEKCHFAEPSIEYLGHTLSQKGTAKRSKVDALVQMPPPTNVSSLRSFLGSIQFYSKFLPNLATVLAPLHQLTKKDSKWKWDSTEEAAFRELKKNLCADTQRLVLEQSFFTAIQIAANGQLQTFPRRLQKFKRQIQKEALAIIFALKKFHQFLYGRSFILVTDRNPLIALFGPHRATPVLAANRLARWALMLNQYQYSIEYRKTSEHGNADALSRFPAEVDNSFDGEKDEADVDVVCAIRTIGQQLNPTDPGVLARESANDPVISNVIRCTREGWPERFPEMDYSMENLRKISMSLSVAHGCLLNGSRVVIPSSLQPQVLQLLHLGHFGIQRMKHKATTDLLEQDFAHFGYPHTIVTDNSTSFLSEEFQTWCCERGIVHLTGALYHPATNRAAERMVQTFKQALHKSLLPPKAALQEFLMQYRRTPLAEGYSPSEILNGRQIRSKIDIMLPSPAHIAQGKQAKSAIKSQLKQLRPRHGIQEDDYLGDTPTCDSNPSNSSLEETYSDILSGQDMLSESPKPMPTPQEPSISEPKPPPNPKPRNPRLPTGGDMVQKIYRGWTIDGERVITAECRAIIAEERAVDAERRAIIAEERAKSAEERAKSAEERAKSAEERAKIAEERATKAETIAIAEKKHAKAAKDKLHVYEQSARHYENSATTANNKAAASEQRAIVAEKRATDAEVKCAANERRAIAAASVAEKKARMNEQKAIDAENKSSVAEKKAKINEQKAITAEKRASIAEEEAVVNEKRAIAAEKRASVAEKEAEANVQSAIAAEEKASVNEQRATSAERECANLKEQLQHTMERATTAERNATSFERKANDVGTINAHLRGKLFNNSKIIVATEEKAKIAEDRAIVAEDRSFVHEKRAKVAEDRAVVAEARATTAEKRASEAEEAVRKLSEDKIAKLELLIKANTKQILDLKSQILVNNRDSEAKVTKAETEKQSCEATLQVQYFAMIDTPQMNNDLHLQSIDLKKLFIAAIETADTAVKDAMTLQHEILGIQNAVAQLMERANHAEQGNRNLSQLLTEATKQKSELSSQHQSLQKQLVDSNKQLWILNKEDIVLTDKELGRGGWGVVYVAQFCGLEVAAKSLHADIVSPYNQKMFEREMNIAARIRHPNLLLFIGATINDKESVILTELMHTSLRAILESNLKEESQLSQKQICALGADVALALNYLHSMKPDSIIHRDVSSANVLLNPRGDTWIAKLSDYGSCNFLRLVNTQAPGNYSYAAPESLDPSLQSPKMDVFSFGILLIEMVSGTFPDMQQRNDLIQKIGGQWLSMKSLIEDCIVKDPYNRLSIADVLSKIVGI